MVEERSVIAFLTGQSARNRTALDESQRRFLAGLPVGGDVVKLDVNFPYHPDTLPYASPALPVASWNNIVQYVRSRSASFAALHREQVLAAFCGYSRVILLAGSCGLELLANLALPPEFLSRTHVFAYGPVSRSVPRCATLEIVQAKKDFISRRWHRRADHHVDCGHMGYLESPEIRALFLDFYHRVMERAC